MDKLSLKFWSCQFYTWVTSQLMNEFDEHDLSRSAVVFSPHFDDETLGCGGTIIKKKRAGADIKIVFMTDGSKSHRHLIAEDQLSTIRATESVAVCRLLGIDVHDIFFFGFEETKLKQHLRSATDKVTEVLMREQPEQIFIPYYKESPSDHFATNTSVLSALRLYRKNILVYEYPIWFWQCWPWVSIPKYSLRTMVAGLRKSFVSGLSLIKNFRCGVYIGDFLGLKRASLDQYKSQMTRFIAHPHWMTLTDISDGEFLKCFFGEYEVFYQHNFQDENEW
jgi:LmbE family N-acetylglucosaminyl deacetylase